MLFGCGRDGDDDDSTVVPPRRRRRRRPFSSSSAPTIIVLLLGAVLVIILPNLVIYSKMKNILLPNNHRVSQSRDDSSKRTIRNATTTSTSSDDMLVDDDEHSYNVAARQKQQTPPQDPPETTLRLSCPNNTSFSNREIRSLEHRLFSGKKKATRKKKNKTNGEGQTTNKTIIGFTKKNALWVPDNQVLFLHMGKAGGGTIGSSVVSKWGYRLVECHGSSTTCFLDPEEGYLDGWDDRLVLLTIRDPIDRFTSAFNWDVKLSCKEQQETRISVNLTNLAVLYPDEYCHDPTYNPERKHSCKTVNETRKVAIPSVWSVLYPDKYCTTKSLALDPALRTTGPIFQRSAEKMALDLCYYDGDRTEVNQTSMAYQSMTTAISHLKGCSISEYLGEKSYNGDTTVYDWKKQMNRLIPIVMEKGWDLEQATDEALISAAQIQDIRTNFFAQDDLFQDRFQWATCLSKKRLDDDVGEVNVAMKHSSAISKDGSEKLLSSKAQRCLARYYQRDYQILQELLDLNVCKTEQCSSAIQSILDRRRPLLEAS